MNRVSLSLHRACLGAASAVVFAAGTPLAAQDGLIVNGRMVSAVRNLGEDLGPAPAIATGPSIGGARYTIVGYGIVDRRTGHTVYMPPTYTVLAVDPVRPRVFIRDPGTLISAIDIVDATSGQRRAFTLVGPAQALIAGSVQVAWSVDRIYIDVADSLFAPGAIVHDVRVFDGATGARLPGGFTFTGRIDTSWTVTPEGDVAYVAQPDGTTVIDLVRNTRRVVAVRGALTWDDLNERLFVADEGFVSVLARDGTLLGSAGMGQCYALALSAHTGRLYVRRGQQATAGSIEDVRVFDSRTYALLGQAFLPYRIDCNVTVLAAPGPPRALAATVAGHDVALSWVNVGAASNFVLDVGLAPGRTDLSIGLGPDTRTSFPGVPSGTYYLRLRGGNEIGGGRASDEIRLVVP